MAIGSRRNFGRDSFETVVFGLVVAAERESHQRRAAFHDLHPELPGDLVTKRRRADLRNRKTSRGNHQGSRCQFSRGGFDAEMLWSAGNAVDIPHLASSLNPHS